MSDEYDWISYDEPSSSNTSSGKGNGGWVRPRILDLKKSYDDTLNLDDAETDAYYRRLDAELTLGDRLVEGVVIETTKQPKDKGVPPKRSFPKVELNEDDRIAEVIPKNKSMSFHRVLSEMSKWHLSSEAVRSMDQKNIDEDYKVAERLATVANATGKWDDIRTVKEFIDQANFSDRERHRLLGILNDTSGDNRRALERQKAVNSRLHEDHSYFPKPLKLDGVEVMGPRIKANSISALENTNLSLRDVEILAHNNTYEIALQAKAYAEAGDVEALRSLAQTGALSSEAMDKYIEVAEEHEHFNNSFIGKVFGGLFK